MLLESAVIHQFAFHEWGEGVLIRFELVIKAARSGAPSPMAFSITLQLLNTYHVLSEPESAMPSSHRLTAEFYSKPLQPRLNSHNTLR
jgi:hypothetical protein